MTTTIPRQAINPLQVLLIDDDDLSRELLTLLLSGEEFKITAINSGDAALQQLQTSPALPQVILADLQMPGTSGSQLAIQLRSACPATTTLLAMSGSKPRDDAAHGYDGFLLKPFTRQQFAAAIAGTPDQQPEQIPTAGILDETVFQKFCGSAPISQAIEMYAFCLRDAEKRLATMRKAASTGDDAAYRQAAHAIKGSCGMLGATELQRLAESMEEHGLADANHVASCDEFVLACERLQGILIQRETRFPGSKTPDSSGEGAQ